MQRQLGWHVCSGLRVCRVGTGLGIQAWKLVTFDAERWADGTIAACKYSTYR